MRMLQGGIHDIGNRYRTEEKYRAGEKIREKSAGRMMTEKECTEMKKIIEMNVARSREIKEPYQLKRNG